MILSVTDQLMRILPVFPVLLWTCSGMAYLSPVVTFLTWLVEAERHFHDVTPLWGLYSMIDFS
jgi:hypothetical protein